MTALVLDCDGVTVDSEPISVAAWSSVLSNLGFHHSDGDIAAFIGRTERDLAHHFGSLVGVEPGLLEAAAQRSFLEVVDGRAEQFPDAAALRRVWGNRPTAIASNSPRWRLDAVLRSARVDVEVTVAGDEVERPKPQPDVYRRALELLDIAADFALVIEDTAIGIAAARAAGCRVVAVHRGAVPRHTLEAADRIVDDLCV